MSRIRSLAENTLAALLICAAALAAYWNCFRNGFHLDDWHGLNDNPLIRDLHNIPKFFADPNTLSVSRLHADYRPLLQVTFALNYAISGYDQWSWHALNLVLHAWVAFNLFLLGRLLFGTARVLPISWLPERRGDAVALFAALLFTVHPVTAGCVNYIWARSSLLTAAFAMPAVVLYIRLLRDWRNPAWFLLPAILLAGAILSKIEGASVFAVVLCADLLLAPDSADLPLWRRAFRFRAWLRLAPCALVIGAYLGTRHLLIPWSHYNEWGQTGVTRLQYFLTQVTAWWYYVGKILLPVNQIADYGGYHVVLTPSDPLFIAAAAGWALVAFALLCCLRRAPQVAFLGASFFLYLAPHSSIMPLAEMVNEHRPYLADTGVFLILVLLLVRLCGAVAPRPVPLAAAITTLLLVPLTVLTVQRNRVFANELSYWRDIADKDPIATRAQTNYGLQLMTSDPDEAQRRFERAIELAPQYMYAHVNLAIVLQNKGRLDEARRHYDTAISCAPGTAVPYYYRGLFRKRQNEYQLAAEDFQKAADYSAIPARELAELADVQLKLKRDEQAVQSVRRGIALDRTPFLGLYQPLLVAGVDHTTRHQYDTAEQCLTLAGELWPQSPYPEVNLAFLADAKGQKADARAHYDRAIAISPNDPEVYAWRAKFLDASGDLAGAIADYRRAVQLRPRPVGDLVSLADTLIRAHQLDEAEKAVEQGEELDPRPFVALRARLPAPR